MKKLTFCFFALILIANIQAQTNVSGSQSGTWLQSNSPYNVTGNISIPQGQILTIEAGVEIHFTGHYKITVLGKLLSQGSDVAPVLFTADNHTTGWGGILLDHASQISVFNHTIFEYGIATGSFPDMHGGAIKLNESDAEFYDCIFQNNKAVGSGEDGMGGAVYGINTGSAGQTLTKFINCKFINNQSITEGGAIKFTNDGNTEITNCQFINNMAKYGGGAIMFYSAIGVHLTKTLFYNNTTQYSGGGAIKAMNPTVSLFLTNCTFAKNSAPTSEGGALALDYSNATFVNCIIRENTQQYGDEINIGMNASVSVDYSDLVMPSDATGNNNINIDPQFVDINNGNLHLQSGSPCIDAGIDTGLNYQGSAPDMGCFEFGQTNYISLLSDNINIYPIPSSSYISIEGGNDFDNIKIYSLSGKLVKNIKFKHKIDLSELAKGNYLLKIFSSNKLIKTQKIIIE